MTKMAVSAVDSLCFDQASNCITLSVDFESFVVNKTLFNAFFPLQRLY